MPATLHDYLDQVQRFLRDQKQELENPGDLIHYVNVARREVAMRAQCLRALPPISGEIVSLSILNGGTGYTNPTLSISPPDQASGQLPFPLGDQATGDCSLSGGVITSADITYGGQGYFQPTVTVNDPTGKGAVIQPNLVPLSLLQNGQEVYPFSNIPLANYPGFASVYLVRSVSIVYTNYRYSVPIYAFTTYQARIRQYTIASYSYVPCFGAQFGRGTNGSFYLYPPPSQTYQLEFDCSCLPTDLTDKYSVEAIPDPWTDAVAYFAAHLAYLELQNHNTARSYLALFDDRMHRFGAYADPGRSINPYGRP